MSSRFVWEAGEGEWSQCSYCVHKFSDSFGCSAFPDQIPNVILHNEFDHRQPYPGDHGIQFEALDGFQSPFEAQEAAT